jgi:hypothetical protein
LTWISAQSRGMGSTGFQAPGAATGGITMAYESEWDGFTALAASGVVEALYSAGVDCSVHERCEQVDAGNLDERERD